jgi:phosphate starvation-inducible PhoH-like protein
VSKNAVRNRKRSSIRDVPPEPTAKEKFFQIVTEQQSYEKQQTVPKFEAANNNQKRALAYFKDGRQVLFLTGSAGTGKSMLAAWQAANLLKQKKINKVYLVRPAVSVGKSIGLLPGDVKEKLTPYFMQTMTHLRNFLGAGYMNYCIEKETIEMQPVEYLRGMSFEDCMVIAEEVQNFSAEEMEMMLTRLGKNCTIIFTGDTKQHDLKGISGLSKTISLLDHVQTTAPVYLSGADLDALDAGVGIVRFTPEDVVRSGLTRAFVKMYYNNDH